VLGTVDEAEFLRTQEYGRVKNNFGFVRDWIGLLQTVVDLHLMPYLWNGIGLRTVLGWGYTAEHELLRMLVVSLITCAPPHTQLAPPSHTAPPNPQVDRSPAPVPRSRSLPLGLALDLPLSAYSTFVIEERFGFNKYTLRSWLSDKAKGLAVEMVLSATMMAPLILVLRGLGERAWLYAWAFITVFSVVFNMLYPVLIEPLFNTFKPLDEGPVRDAIEQLVTQTGLNCKKIVEVDGSRQSNHSNAYVAGFFGTKRITIFDTLLTHLSGETDDICAIVGHEIGHSIMHHNYMMLAQATLQLFLTFFTYGLVAEVPTLVSDFGFEGTCTFLKLNTFFLLYNSALSPILGPLNWCAHACCGLLPHAKPPRLARRLPTLLSKASLRNLTHSVHARDVTASLLAPSSSQPTGTRRTLATISAPPSPK
jgi:STE24 endopeptidase